jgi:hypothetical protein
MMTPLECIECDPPNVWLTSFYGFAPELWGLLGFSQDGHRKHFISNTKPDALVVIYGHKTKSPKHQQGMVIGIQQVSHNVNHSKGYMDPSEWLRKEADPERAGKWNLAVKATRAWHVAPEAYVPIEDFAPDTYTTGKAQHIGSYGVRLKPAEARRILSLRLIETSVFGEIPVDAAVLATGQDQFAPSKPGPVSQSPFMCKEAEGPKSLYILRLCGNADAFLGYPSDNKSIIKVGMSGSPEGRCLALNSALPRGAFRWELIHFNARDGKPLFPRSKPAIAAETAIKTEFHIHSRSLGGEFFLADEALINSVWNRAMEALKT